MSNIAISDAPPIDTGSPERFGYEWNEYAEMRPEYEEQFRRWTVHLAPDDWRGKTFLDVGCGMGRNSYWPMRYGAAGGKAIDVDQRSLGSARRPSRRPGSRTWRSPRGVCSRAGSRGSPRGSRSPFRATRGATS